MPSDPIGPHLLLQFALILLNAFFAAAEIAVISVNDNKLKMMAEAGDKKAIKLLEITQNPTKFLSTIQVGITLAGFLGAAFAADNFASRITYYFVNSVGVTEITPKTINTIAVVVITLVLSFLTLVLGELVPKRIAMQSPEKLARAFCGIISFLKKIMKPVIALLTASTNLILRLFRIDPNKHDPEISEEEIMYMVDAADEKGAIGKNEKQMIENIFEFNNMDAEDVMIHRTDIEFIKYSATDEEIIDTIKITGLSRFPVYKDDFDDIVGILIARDFLLNYVSGSRKPFDEILRPAYFVPESVRTDILFRNMQNDNTHMAIIVDEYGGTSGLVTMEDLIEEIVGNIYDESDFEDECEITALDEDTWRIAGSALLEEISEILGIEFPEDDEFDTLGGFIINELSAIPLDGTTPHIEKYGYEFTVEEIKERRIEWARVRKLPEETEKSTQEEAKISK